MNNEQLKYARVRAKDAYDYKLNILKREFTTQQIRLTPEQRIKALKDGNFTIKKQPSGNAYYLADVIDFPGEVNAVFDTVGYEAKAEVVRKAYNALTDELVLGDNEQALQLLRQFEAL